MHKLDLDTAVNAEDHTFEASGVHVAILKRQVEMLRGAQVDFGRENDKEGFKVKNPNFEGEAAKRWLSVLQNDPVAK
jgi:Fe-S cluster assembly iron-binding protein IscA